ncbi:DDE-type integrase/transposase/recombinase [Serratia marcescens]|uniref:DDE-type integrase/transposase/recombinase n=1 Tax=Serratia marcescens TaxID=615 RepID=A0A5C7BS21_SERMA|nr:MULTISPECIES: Mu transposase C-terminal domain-containing protein [Serratia]TXE27119.1 DDE-type integrase/transposase/recombinase [Serratia marcescens]TXE55324.1 DDE-type integrase/transposase/recombinase [Serratia marcescens]
MFLSVNELVGLSGLPGTVQGVRYVLNKSAGDSSELKRKREGSKAFEYHIDCLPAEAREVVRQRHYTSVMEQSGCKSVDVPVRNKKAAVKPSQELDLLRQCPALLEREVGSLTDKQKQIADARALLAQEVETLINAGMSRSAAVQLIADRSRDGSLPDRVMVAADVANARKGKTRTGVSVRCLQEWVTTCRNTGSGAERLALLAPGHLKAKKPEQIGWLVDFLPHWRSPNGFTLSAAYRLFRVDWAKNYVDQPAMLAAIPSYHAVRRAMEKFPRRELMRGRVSGSAARALETYQKRDWSQMPVNGCWVSDGKSMNMKVAHPIHGQPFTPELTLIIDGRTRYVVGWSLSLAESTLAVADAYRFAVKHHGKPLFVYSDNGGGQTNKTFDADITGIFPRVNITHMTSIPGNPQARGIIERLNGVIPLAAAQQFVTFNGTGADDEHVRITERGIKSALIAMKGGLELNSVQQRAIKKLPSWRQLLDVVASEVDKYNHSHEHSELPKYNGRHLTPAQYRQAVLEAEGDEIEYLTELELREMFMPEVIRVARRGWVEVENNDYFSEELINVDGEKVRVAFDTHDANEVIVRRMDGSFVCTAIWNGNKQVAIPVTRMQKAQQERTQRRLNRVEEKKEEILAEGREVLEHQPDFNLGITIDAQPVDEHDGVFLFETDRDEYLKKTGSGRL